jgi:[histone H3]-lysine36 N-dimethyltransferase SETMAR
LKKQPDLVNYKTKLLLHDNAPSHVAKQTIHKLKELGYEILPHPPYSPDISPTDDHLFLSLDNFLRSISNITDIEKAFIGSRRPDFFKSGINKLVVINANGAYFEE